MSFGIRIRILFSEPPLTMCGPVIADDSTDRVTRSNLPASGPAASSGQMRDAGTYNTRMNTE